MTSCIEIAGWGAVSPAGWSVSALVEAIEANMPLPVDCEQRKTGAPQTKVRRVPNLSQTPAWLKAPRLRRTSPISRYAASAMMKALHRDTMSEFELPKDLGIIFAVQNGSVQYSRRFFAEALENPLLASPILFPETVFNAPSSHLSSLVQSATMNNTLVGDAGGFVAALDLAAQWLSDRAVSHCLVVAAEENDWVSAEALALFPGDQIAAEGAAALWLNVSAEPSPGAIVLEQITQPAAVTRLRTRASAIMMMKEELQAPKTAWLIQSLTGSAAWDRPHLDAFSDWQGRTLDVETHLGHGFSVLGGWQCALACQLLHTEVGVSRDAVVVGDCGASQATAAWFRRS